MESDKLPAKPQGPPLRSQKDVPMIVFSPLLIPLLFMMWAILA